MLFLDKMLFTRCYFRFHSKKNLLHIYGRPLQITIFVLEFDF